MEIQSSTILVPTDFSVVAEYGLQHAVRVANIIKLPITMLHLVSEPQQLDTARQQLDKLTQRFSSQYDVQISPMARVGNVLEDIALIASELSAEVVIMGSSTIKQMDGTKISWTLKVITGCRMPVLVIQEPPVNKRYDNVVFPIDYTPENTAKHKWIAHFSDYYLSKFHLVKPHTDDPKLLAKIDMNMASALRFLDEKGAQYEITTVPGILPYQEEILLAAVDLRADLIVLMTTPHSHCNFTIEPIEQHILANARQIPVMCMNPI